MIVLIQRVSEASVIVENETVGSIGKGLLLLVGAENGDSEDDVVYCARKCAELRVFSDEYSKMNLSLKDVNGESLVVSQFTLPGRVEKGRRPSFTDAMAGEGAEKLYDLFVDEMQNNGIKTKTGKFAAMMDVHLVNDGPVTLILDSKKRKK